MSRNENSVKPNNVPQANGPQGNGTQGNASQPNLPTKVAAPVSAQAVVSTAATNGAAAPVAMVTIAEIRRDPEVVGFLQAANDALRTLGFTEHGQRHAGLVGHIAESILERLGMAERVVQLANIAGYLHDIGNSIHRQNHALSGSLMAWQILKRMGMSVDECALIMNAIGNHEEERGSATNPVAAALIIADKADVHRSRVQNPRMEDFDIHDRVNYATTRSFVRVRPEENVIALELEIDVQYAQVIEYFEIFLERMTMVRQAVEFLGCTFQLIINDTRVS